MNKTFVSVVRESFNVRSSADHRRRVNKILTSYKDSQGYEYRKAYEFPTTYSFDDMISSIPKEI